MARKRQPKRPRTPSRLTERDKRVYLKVHLAIIERIEDRQASSVKLSLNERDYVAAALRYLWLSKHELRAYRRQQRLESIESVNFLLKHSTPLQVLEAHAAELRKSNPQLTEAQALAKVYANPNHKELVELVKHPQSASDRADQVRTFHDFPTVEAMAQFVKRERKK